MSLAQKEKYSRSLIWIGVLAWVPYIAVRLIGRDVSAVPFLMVHLTGVLGGLILHSQVSKGAPEDSQKIQGLKRISTILLLAGVSVWGVYFGLQFLQGRDLKVTLFLITHLAFMFSGAGIKMYIFTRR